MRKCPILVLILTVFFVCSLATGRERVVTTTADSGPGSLRWALQVARPGDVITFDPAVFPPDTPATIYPLTELPPITCGGVTIDASNAGVVVDGSMVSGDCTTGIQVYSDGNTVMGLSITGFSCSGIAVCGGSHNVIGGDRSRGIGPNGQGNCVGENGIGIDICDYGTQDNHIIGNLVGITADGQPWGNFHRGIWIENGAAHNTIGPGNVIAYNHGVGSAVEGDNAYGNRITENNIFANEGQPIRLWSGGNRNLASPSVEEYNSIEGLVIGSVCAGCTVEIFIDQGDAGLAYQGQAVADEQGNFTFSKGGALDEGAIIATATDAEGNTSEFSKPLPTDLDDYVLQLQGDHSLTPLKKKQPSGLGDNRMWTGWPITEGSCGDSPDAEWIYMEVTLTGVKHIEIDLNGEFEAIHWDVPEFEINPCQRGEIDLILANPVDMSIIMRFWDKEAHAQGQDVTYPRFQTEKQIQDYLEYVRFIVRALKDSVTYYVVWSEPTILDTPQWIRADDYVELLRRTIPVIREEDPEAKIVTAHTDYLIFQHTQDFLFTLLQSDVMPLVDVISWHPMYGTSPEYDFHREYYYGYPQLVRRIKETAEAHGFRGEYLATELTWGTEGGAEGIIFDPTVGWPMVYTQLEAAKYLARAILLHLGMDVEAGYPAGMAEFMAASYSTVQNLCTVMAGHESIDMPVKVDINYEGPVAYCSFRYPNGDRMLAIWTDGIAQDEDPGVPATIRFPGLMATTVTGIDVLHSFQQELEFKIEDDATVVRDVLVKDYPILVRLSGVSFGPGYSEAVGDGFHRFGNVDAIFGKSEVRS